MELREFAEPVSFATSLEEKLRAPGVYVFNAFAEGRLAEGKKFNPTKPQAQLARDLENLPQFLCRQDDIVLVTQKPSGEFLSGIKQAGFLLPEFVEVGGSGARLWPQAQPQRAASTGDVGKIECAAAGAPHTAALRELAARKLGSLRPWAWGPDSLELLKPVFASVTGEKRDEEKRFNASLAQLYSKTWSADFLRKILSCRSRGDETQISKPEISQSLLTSAPTEKWLCSENEIGVAVNSLEAAFAEISKIRARGHHRIVVKESLGVAGSNALRLFEPTLLPAQLRWLENEFAHQRELVVEPWLERELDFSAQLEMGPQLNDARGQFQANFAEPHHHQQIPAKVVALFREPKDISSRLLEFYGEIFAALEDELRRVDFTGPIGIDAFVYRDANGAVKLKPVVEINPRYTMGRVLVELMRQTCQNCFGSFRLVNAAQLRAEGFENFPTFAQSLAEKFPLLLEGNPPHLRSGALCLNDPATAQVCLAVFQVGRPAAEAGI